MQHVEFWSLRRVVEVTGCSKSEVYRLMRIDLFPKSNAYRATPKKRFWLSHEIKEWQQAQLDKQVDAIMAGLPKDDFESLLSEVAS